MNLKAKYPAEHTARISQETKYSYLAFAFIFITVALCYSNIWQVPILFDDYATLVENMSIRSLTAFETLLSPPTNPGLGWRPFANITFALSYAISGLNPWAHHLFSIIIHICSASVLFVVVKKTLQTKSLEVKFGQDSILISGFIALLWALHPIQTQTITYISQRTEALMGLMYLLTIYGFIRGIQTQKVGWYSLSLISCVLGVLSKEVIVTAPVLVLLYDRTFFAGSFKGALKVRWKYYIALASSWIPFLILVKTIQRQAVGFGIGVSWFTYSLTECKALITYLRLSLWPHPLIFDRGTNFLYTISEAFPYALVLLALLSLTIYALIKKPVLGFVCACFFIILSPTSSFVPVAEVPIAENRIYLPLAAVMSLLVLGIYTYLGKKILRIICTVLITTFLVTSHIRNRDYSSSISIWTDAVKKEPNNPRALNDLGYLLLNDPSHKAEAEHYFQEALRQKPHYSDALTNLGMLYAVDPAKIDQANNNYLEAIKYSPKNAEAHSCYANLIAKIPGKKAEAIEHLLIAINLKPYSAEFHNNYAAILANDPSKQKEALDEYKKAIQLNPNYAQAHNNLANLYCDIKGKETEAIAEYRKALQCDSKLSYIHFNLGLILKLNASTAHEALDEFRLALALNPNDSPSQVAIEHCNIALILESNLDYLAAIKEYNIALSIYPAIPQAHLELIKIYQALGDHDNDVIQHFKSAITLGPETADLNTQFADYLSRSSPRDALIMYKAALKLDPNYRPAKEGLLRLTR